MSATLLLLALAAPTAPPKQAPKVAPVTDAAAGQYADRMAAILPGVIERSLKKVGRRALVEAAIDGLFRAVNRTPPAQLQNLSDDVLDTYAAFKLARQLAGADPELDGIRAYIHSTNGLAKALDPSCVLSLAHNGPFSMSDQELLGGIELDDIKPIDWMEYRVETGPTSGWTVPPPVPLPWKVKRLTPGLAAAQADLRAGDEIVSIDGVAVTPRTTSYLLPPLLVPLTGQNQPDVGKALGQKLRLGVRREGRELTVALEIPKALVEELPRESVFGYKRRPNGTWDYFPNKADRVAYLRLSVFDDETPQALVRALNEIAKDNPAGLLVDLRWTPGGSLQSGGRTAGVFFRDDQPIAKVTWADPKRSAEQLPRLPAHSVDDLWRRLPLAVLVNGETFGGGEALAAAVKDHKRGLVIGQRTPGRGLFYTSVGTSVVGLRYRVTSGRIDLPSGKNRHRHENLGPLDDWGVRPDAGFEVPMTGDLSRKLRDWHEQQTTRPAGERNAVPLDDPLTDSQRALALKLFKGWMGKKK
jgi:C-terminal processing protease CtpA/Prc